MLSEIELGSPDPEFWAALQNWKNSYYEQREQAISTLKQNTQNCPLKFCPMRQIEFDEDDTSFEHKNELEEKHAATEPGEVILEIMSIGGGRERKSPLSGFLDLVRKCHKDKNSSKISEVIVTDKYVSYPVNHTGVGGGYDNFLAYLNAVGINTNTNCILKFLHGGNSESHQILERTLKQHFPLISIKPLNSALDFHDRFYFVRYKNGQLEGVFGPSLNGLSAKAIVLMGKLESDALKLLDQICR